MIFAPGSRVVIRDEEWLIRRVDPSTDGGWLLTCDGVSELVRGRDALFLTELEDQIEVLDPAQTRLVADDSPTYTASLLYLESMRRRSVANDERIHLGHKGVMNLVPYQLDPALQALRQPRSRILIADAVGLGKTLEAGVLATELIQRGRGKRILVVTQKAMIYEDGVRPALAPLYDPVCVSSFFAGVDIRTYAQNRQIDKTLCAFGWDQFEALMDAAGLSRKARLLQKCRAHVRAAKANWPDLMDKCSAPQAVKKEIIERLQGKVAIAAA